VKSSPCWSEISSRFRLFVFFSAILSLNSNAFGASGQITPSPSTINFGSVAVGASQTQPVTLTNSGGTKVTITQAALSGTGFTFSGLTYPVTLEIGQSATGHVTFAPQSSGTDNSTVSISFMTPYRKRNALASFTVNLPVSGTGMTSGQLSPAPASLSFGSIQVGSSHTMTEMLTNSGGSSVTISAASATGAGFGTSGLTLPTTLSAGQSVSFSVIFAPTSGSSVSGNLAITSNASDPALNVPLSGTATTASGQLAIAPTTISFGNVTVGASENQTSILSASGAPVTVSSLGVSGSQFSVSGLTLPVTIPAGNSVSFGLTFAPQSSGTVSANVSFASNASNSPSVEVVTGSGIMPQHSVALGWNTSTSSGVVGYNIYRGTVSGGPYTRINSALDSTPYDTDSSVQAGSTYYYVVTAVESSGAESTYSNQAQAAIPAP